MPLIQTFSKTRIAPTPSGFLHMGNVLSFALTAALARQFNARILLRIDDLDQQRVDRKYVQDIFDTLHYLEIPWEEGPRDYEEYRREYSQLHRLGLYQQALETLRASGQLFACTCSRAMILQNNAEGIYPGACENKNISLETPDVSWRIRTDPSLPLTMKDFIVRKKDGLPAYQLTSVIDDQFFGVDLIVRGEDLRPSTLAQQYLSQWLPGSTFRNNQFYHHPLLLGSVGKKLSKSAGSTSIQHLREEGKKKEEIYSLIAGQLGYPNPVRDFRELASLVLPFILVVVLTLISINDTRAQSVSVTMVPTTSTVSVNHYYPGNRAPLLQDHFSRLPVTAFRPEGWLKRQLELQRDGLTGHLGEISIWLSRKDNAWLNRDGKGKYGWEELPYWLKGYANIGYMLRDQSIIRETSFWINAVLNNQRPDGDFGPVVLRNGNRDLWTNMPMLWCLQSWYEYSQDARVLTFMKRYFKWELSVPDGHFLKDYWENSRGGDNLYSVYWLYNHTGDSWLLDLAAKIDRNTANWRQADNLPNWHNVNIAQCFREPAMFYLQSHLPADLDATYRDFSLVRDLYGQVPGGMFGADENARKGYDDPRQAIETCGMVEQMTSDEWLLRSTGDTKWADHCEDVAFNSFPAAFMPDYRALRYLTAPNMVISDGKNHHPGIDNAGPFLMMNPFSSRCCQHNHAAGWVYYAENAWMATPDNGLAAQFYTSGELTAQAGDGHEIRLEESTHYPFDETVRFTVHTKNPTAFPLYLRVPSWCTTPRIEANGKPLHPEGRGHYIRLHTTWKEGDTITLTLPMSLHIQQWTSNKNSVSVYYGPLGFSLKIKEDYIAQDSRQNAMDDSHWQETADPGKWPSYEIRPASDWNYGLLLNSSADTGSFTIRKKNWPADNNPFTNMTAPIEIITQGRQIPSWTIDSTGLCGVLPPSPVTSGQPTVSLTLVPMGGARLRISAFPVIQP